MPFEKNPFNSFEYDDIDIEEELYEAVVICPDLLLTRQQASDFMGINKTMLRRWEDIGKIVPTTTVGRLKERRYSLKYLVQFMRRHKLYLMEKVMKQKEDESKEKARLKQGIRDII